MARPSPLKIGTKYGRLTAIGPTDRPRINTCIVWEFLCDCGKPHFAVGKDVYRGDTTSCGCFQKETLSKRFTTHGATTGKKTRRSYRIWQQMKKRCKPGYEKAHRYYDRGIRVCDRWLKYENFLADMGEPPPGTSLDRINNNGNYEPGNCRWADDITQQNNKGCRCETYSIRYAAYISFALPKAQTTSILPKWAA